MISVKYSIETEVDRIYNPTLWFIYNGFYTSNNLYVVPYGTDYKIDKDAVVLMPNFDYSRIKKELMSIKSEIQYDKNAKDLKKQIQEEFIRSNTFVEIDSNKLNQIENMIKKALDPIIKKTPIIINQYYGKKINVTIYPTFYGTNGSFNLIPDNDIKNNENIEIILRPRLDKLNDPSCVVELYSSVITRSLINQNKNLSWRETESISDFFTKFVFSQANHIGTLDTVTKLNPILLEKSQTFLLQNNLPTGKPLVYDYNSNNIYCINENITDILAPYEFRLLRSLIKNYNNTISFEELSEDIYNSHADVKFSLWGINKTVQRVRDKLETVGIPRESLQNVKGEGFKLRG